MRLTFLGTRAYIEERNRRHRRNAALLVEHQRRRIMVDCGEDWAARFRKLRPHAIVVTHAHPDHADGLKQGAPYPVWAPEPAWKRLRAFDIEDGRTLPLGKASRIEGVRFRPFHVEHSINCPAVGLRIEAGGRSVFYAPDVISIHDESAALDGVDLYIGDGSTITRPLVRRRGEHLIGHTTIRAQLGWCERNGIPRAIFTHCGSEIVQGDERKLGPQLARMARERGGVDARLAYDGLQVNV